MDRQGRILIRLYVAITILSFFLITILLNEDMNEGRDEELAPLLVISVPIHQLAAEKEETFKEISRGQSTERKNKKYYEIYKDGIQVDVSAEYQQMIRDFAIQYNYDEKIIIGMILCESTFQADAVGGGCYGWAQINPFWIKGANVPRITNDYRSRNLKNPYDNLLTLMEMWNYARDTYKLNLETQEGYIKLLYWHNTGKDPRHITSYRYAAKILGYSQELVSLH